MIDCFKSGFEPPGDFPFEDYSQNIYRTISDGTISTPKQEGMRIDSKTTVGKAKGKLWLFGKKPKVTILKLLLVKLKCEDSEHTEIVYFKSTFSLYSIVFWWHTVWVRLDVLRFLWKEVLWFFQWSVSCKVFYLLFDVLHRLKYSK